MIKPSGGDVRRVTHWRFEPGDDVPKVESPFRQSETYFQPTLLTLTESINLDGTDYSTHVKVSGFVITKSGALGKSRDSRNWHPVHNFARPEDAPPQWIQDITDPVVNETKWRSQ